MKFTDTIVGRVALGNLKPSNLPALFSAARSEFLHAEPPSFDGPFMQRVREVLDRIGREVYGTGFSWTPYNAGQWMKFVASAGASIEGGACMFSCEPDGDYAGQAASNFKGIGLGVPTGIFPYALWTCLREDRPKLQAAVAGFGCYSLDMVCDHEGGGI